MPKAYRWGELAKREGLDQLDYYKRLLARSRQPKSKTRWSRAIFTDAQTKLRKPTNLKSLTDAASTSSIGSRRARKGWATSMKGLLEKNAAEKKSGAGQYFTPRPLIDCIVRLMKPQAGEVVQDPAAGTAGFLVAADRYIKDAHRRSLSSCRRAASLLPAAQRLRRARARARHASPVPDEPDAARHRGAGVEFGDTLSPDGERLPKADLILTNPPFGTKKGGGRPRAPISRSRPTRRTSSSPLSSTSSAL